MKLVIISLMMMLLLLQTFSKGILLLQFHLNQDYIARISCVNKDNFQMKCKGKCQLSKKMKTEDGQKAVNVKFKEFPFTTNSSTTQTILATNMLAHFEWLFSAKITMHPGNIFHPPKPVV